MAETAGMPQVDRDLREMLIRRDAPPAKKIGVRVWPRAIPQFNVGHQSTVTVSLHSCMPELMSHYPGSDCLRSGDASKAVSVAPPCLIRVHQRSLSLGPAAGDGADVP